MDVHDLEAVALAIGSSDRRAELSRAADREARLAHEAHEAHKDTVRSDAVLELVRQCKRPGAEWAQAHERAATDARRHRLVLQTLDSMHARAVAELRDARAADLRAATR